MNGLFGELVRVVELQQALFRKVLRYEIADGLEDHPEGFGVEPRVAARGSRHGELRPETGRVCCSGEGPPQSR